jgi:hypothetical protein
MTSQRSQDEKAKAGEDKRNRVFQDVMDASLLTAMSGLSAKTSS